MKNLHLALILALCAFGTLLAQSPAPVILQAASAAPLHPAAAVPVSAAPVATKSTLQFLQEMQGTNAATIQKQEAALQSLDALQKAAEEIKIYSKRG